jgi:hypothetical protein
MPYGLEIRIFRFQAIWSIKKSVIMYLVLVNLFSTPPIWVYKPYV